MTEIRLGSITGGHGIKGGIKVFSYTDPVEAIFDYSPWILRKGQTEKRVVIENGQVQGKRLIVRIEGVDSRDLADELAGFEIHVDRQVLPDLEEGTYYWFQLVGFKVSNQQGDLLGVVADFLETGANDVIVVQSTEESVDSKERLIPYVEGDIVLKVDHDNGEIVVDWNTDY